MGGVTVIIVSWHGCVLSPCRARVFTHTINVHIHACIVMGDSENYFATIHVHQYCYAHNLNSYDNIIKFV